MKKTILALVAFSMLVITVGCDPFGSSETMIYVTGKIYVDAAMTTPAEGVGVELLVDPDSSAVYSQNVFTNSSGVFFMEVQMYPSLPNGESGTGYSMPSSVKVGLKAHYNDTFYEYNSYAEGWIVSAGDTLTVWDVSITEFEDPSGGK